MPKRANGLTDLRGIIAQMRIKAKRKFFSYSEYWKPLAVVLLSAASLAIFHIDGRYTIAQRGILPNLDFSQSGRYWIGSKDGVRLTRTESRTLILENEGRRQTLITQTLEAPQRYDNIRVAMDIRLDGVRPGDAWWQKAGVLLESRDRARQRMTYWPSEIALLSGTVPWTHYDRVIPTAAQMSFMQLFILHGGESGLMQIRNLRVDAVTEAAWFGIAEKILFVLWFAVGVWALFPLIAQRYRSPLAYLTLLTFVTMVSVSLTPQPLLSQSATPVARTIETVAAPVLQDRDRKKPAETEAKAKGKKPPGKKEAKPEPEKDATEEAGTAEAAPPVALASDPMQYAAHFSSHVVLGILVGLLFREAAWWRVAGYLLLAASTTELLQVFVITRSAGLDDGLANAAGALVGVLTVVGLRTVRQRRAAA